MSPPPVADRSDRLSPSPGKVMLELSGVTKLFKRNEETGRPVGVHGIDFTAYAGEIVSIVGPSGCGKTTLLRLVAGLLDIDRGEIRVSGRRVTEPGPDRGIVFQQPNLLPWRTARKNVEIGLESTHMTKSDRRDVVTDLLHLVRLQDFADYYPRQLSGGMQQRLGLARALAIDPDVLLMDEPFSALDAWSREELQVELLRLHGTTKKTIIFVTHDLDEAIFLSDRVLALAANPGRVDQVLTIDLPRPRRSIIQIRATPEFREAREALTALLAGGRHTADEDQDGQRSESLV